MRCLRRSCLLSSRHKGSDFLGPSRATALEGFLFVSVRGGQRLLAGRRWMTENETMAPRTDRFEARARELAVAAGLDPDARVDKPGAPGRTMPLWCSYRDAARSEINVGRAVAAQAT